MRRSTCRSPSAPSPDKQTPLWDPRRRLFPSSADPVDQPVASPAVNEAHTAAAPQPVIRSRDRAPPLPPTQPRSTMPVATAVAGRPVHETIGFMPIVEPQVPSIGSAPVVGSPSMAEEEDEASLPSVMCLIREFEKRSTTPQRSTHAGCPQRRGSAVQGLRGPSPLNQSRGRAASAGPGLAPAQQLEGSRNRLVSPPRAGERLAVTPQRIRGALPEEPVILGLSPLDQIRHATPVF